MAVHFAKKQLILSVFTNPVKNGILEISMESEGATAATLQITSLQGKLVKSKAVNLATGMNFAQIPISEIPSGQYLAKLKTRNSVQMAMFIKP